MSRAPAPKSVSFTIRHVTRLRAGPSLRTTGHAMDALGSDSEYRIDRPTGGGLEATDTVVCGHCGRELRITVRTPAGMRRTRWESFLGFMVSVAVAAVIGALVFLSGPFVIVVITLLAFPGGVAVIAVLLFAATIFTAKGVSLVDDDGPEQLGVETRELPPEQQYHDLR
ncbi:hypothetical protein [Glycomyces arizonensis]|uniref:hypothetical protein n=1 Tax=Glycomyces arizonensis TaxID=256035 RepID=UPI00042797F0|nr:hypothetical protein [Glycomyces arizonensis]